MTHTKTKRNHLTGLALMAALLSTSAIAVSPTAALAVPPGGYGDLVEMVSPGVVFIEVTSKAGQADFPQTLPEGIPEEFQRRFRDMMPKEGAPSPRHGVGSGFIISDDGQNVTNHHVVEGAENVVVKMADGRSFDATVVGSAGIAGSGRSGWTADGHGAHLAP